MNRDSDKYLYKVLSSHGRIDTKRSSRDLRWWLTKKVVVTAALLFVFFVSFIAALVFAGVTDSSILSGFSPSISIFSSTKVPEKQEYPVLQCTQGNQTQTCPRNYPTSYIPINVDRLSNATCPSYFRWIHEDLRPWKETGITRDMIDKARRTAHFRLVIVDGRVYVERYRKSYQTRDVFTLWGILQLLRRYPARLPDLELMFDCNDRPVVRARDFKDPNAGPPPPLFRYSSNAQSLDIVFPDWSFWGWAEINIKPWKDVLADIKEGNKRVKWKDRVPYAYWKGNPTVAPTRRDLLKCTATKEIDWNARLYIQNWNKEIKQGFKHSNLGDQCTHRYKIYIEGVAWSVSEKYILACDSMSLVITPHYHDFFTRGLEPLQHYWPIREHKKCTSLKFAVEWGNNHTQEAEEIGKTSSNFMRDNLKMEYIYDYMYHALNEYAKLLRFKPSIPEGAAELCSETMACPAPGNRKKFMVRSMVRSPSDTIPCNLPPPYDPSALRSVFDGRAKIMKQVEEWEDEYWKNQKQNA